MNLKPLFEQLLAKQDLNPQQMQAVITACMKGELSDLHIATFLALLRMKGETAEELMAAASVMRDLSLTIDLGEAIDIVGTGGDGKNTFNVSTASSFVVAACNIAVAKHGNRSVSSSSGSADLFELAGFNLALSDEQQKTCISKCHLAFLFAPHYHPAMAHVRNARQQLGIRTLFNLLGPLVNPALVKKQVVGVCSKELLNPLMSVLAHLGSQRAMVVSSSDGLDEISITAPTEVLELNQGQLTSWEIHPKDYGLYHHSLDKIIVQSPEHSLKLIQSLLAGEKGPHRDIVLLNAASALYCAQNISFNEAIEQAKNAIDKGLAKACFEDLKQLTQTFKEIK